MGFISELKEAIAPEYQRLFTARIWGALMAEEKADIALWKCFLWETYHYTKHNGVNQALAVMRTQTTEKPLLRVYLRHAAEEIDHDFLCLDDLEKLGVSRKDVIRSRPLPETQAFSSLIYDLVIREDPIGRLGYSFWAEGANQELSLIANRLRYHFNLPDDHMKFIVAHEALDKGHVNLITRTIEEHARTQEQQEAIKYFGVATCHQFYYFLEAVFDCYERERAAGKTARRDSRG